MALVPSLDMRDGGDPRDALRKPPHNIEAEQGLLGAVLYDSECFHTLPEGLAGSAFYEPFHGRLFDAIAEAIGHGRAADAVSFYEQFRGDVAFKELGGIKYLADLVDRAPPAIYAAEYGGVIKDLAQRRDLIRLADNIRESADKGTMPAAEIVGQAESELLAMTLHGRAPALISLGEAADNVLAYIDNTTALNGFETGIRPLDLQMGPMMPGDLILCAGRPSMGKSAVSLAIATGVADPILQARMHGMPEEGLNASAGVIEFHGEMTFGDRKTGGQATRRHFSDVGYWLHGEKFPTYRQIRDKKISVEQRGLMEEAAVYLRAMRIDGVKRTGMTLSTLRSTVRRKAADWARMGVPLGLVVIDHVGLIRYDGKHNGRYEAQTEIAIGMKELAGEIEAPILALVQLSRGLEQRDDKRPILPDLRESGAWEENADVVMFVYRDAYYAKREKEPATGSDKHFLWEERCASQDIDLIMGKVREGDAGGTAKVWANLGHNAIRPHRPDTHGGVLFQSGLG